MLLRQGEGWRLVYDALGLDWLEAGCGSEEPCQRTPEGTVARLGTAHKSTEDIPPPNDGVWIGGASGQVRWLQLSRS